MAGAFFFICIFLITVSGLLLFRPAEVKTITNYSQPAALAERKSIAIKMAEFLEKNPQILKQERLTSLPLNPQTIPSSEITTIPPNITSRTPTPYRVEVIFQGSNLQFATLAEYDQWIYKNVSQEPINFLKQFHENDNPELYLDTLKKVLEINSTEDVILQIKSAYLEEAKNLATNKDGFHQQMMQIALQGFLDLEKDKSLGKKIADEILKSNNKPHE